MKLYTKISIGLVAGAALGMGVNLAGWEPGIRWVQSVEILGTAFIRAITMIVIPLVVASLMVGVATLGDLRELGRIGGKTLGYYLCTTAIAVSIGVVLSNLIEPGARIPEESKAALLEAYGGEAQGRIELAQEAPGLRNLLLSLISDNPVQSAAQGDMLPLIIFTILFAAAASVLAEDRKRVLIGFFDAVNHASMVVINWIMVVAPYAVFALIAAVTARFGFDVLRSLVVYAATVVAGLLLQAFGTYALVVKFLARLRLGDFYRRIREAQILAFSTSSSNATLPVTIKVAEGELGDRSSLDHPTYCRANRHAGVGRSGGGAQCRHHHFGFGPAPGQRSGDRDRADFGRGPYPGHVEDRGQRNRRSQRDGFHSQD
jgi:DAACS family dicarboxylate/amino acid:cation (Na+ or H+) symporter